MDISSLRNRAMLCLTWLLVANGCRQDEHVPPPVTPPPADLSVTPWFIEQTEVSGIRFLHQLGDTSQYELAQIMGSGAAWFDFDQDGLLDLYLVNYSDQDVLYRQQSLLSFADATGPSALSGAPMGMGALVGDWNSDGFPDLLVTHGNSLRLWSNLGDGTFEDVTDQVGLDLAGYASAACFCDYNLDGHPDLLVVYYVDYLPGQWCEDSIGRREFCGPNAYSGTIDRLFRHRGEMTPQGAFEEVTLTAGLATNPGKGLGVACGDLTGDGLPDFYVANDMESNHFWQQQPDGTFLEVAGLNGTALNKFGEAEASMGVVSADLTGEGVLQLFITHLSGQTNTLYSPRAGGVYDDLTPVSGLGPPSLPYTGFGIGAFDADQDGTLDLLIANGRVKRGLLLPGADGGLLEPDYAEPNQFFLNTGELRFRPADAEAGEFSRQTEISRGLAVGDIDNDGDVDFVVTNCGGPARLFLNVMPQPGHWLSVRLIGRTSDRDAVGADLFLSLEGQTLRRRVALQSGYLTSNDPRVHFGLGPNEQYTGLTVRWPHGVEEEFPGGEANQHLVIIEGRGIVSAMPAAGEVTN